MRSSSDFSKSGEKHPSQDIFDLDREELAFWERQKRFGDDADLKMARDLPDDAPDYILKMMADFEEAAARFCFSGASGRVLDAGCGNGNLLLRAMKKEQFSEKRHLDDRSALHRSALQVVGMDFSSNMLRRAAYRASGYDRAFFLQGSVTGLPFKDQSFDRIVSSGVLTCLPTTKAAERALFEFYRVLKPGGTLVVDFFNRASHYTLIRKHLFRESIKPPEYVTTEEFYRSLGDAGFAVVSCRGFDFKPCQGYLFTSPWRTLIDPHHFQERLSSFVEDRLLPGSSLNLLGYRIYVKCIRK
jgi:ubiquinone/menaquinone biosynthesis C-methylase UbiE